MDRRLAGNLEPVTIIGRAGQACRTYRLNIPENSSGSSWERPVGYGHVSE